MKKTKNFINLTNGLKAIEEHKLTDYSYIRIQSTACEQKRWNFILHDIDHNFLMNAAQGHKCIVYDYGVRKETSRAMWQGVEWIKFALNKRWYDKRYTLIGRASKSHDYFDCEYRKIDRKTLKKLDYYKPYLSSELNVIWISGRLETEDVIK